MKLKLTYLLFVLLSGAVSAQTFTRSVINSLGGESVWSGGSLTSSVGEAVIITGSSGSNFLTQGFVQPRDAQDLVLTVRTGNAACKTSNDGYAAVSVTGGNSPYTYNWSQTTSPSDSISGLVSGSYTVAVTDASGNTAIQAFSIGVISDVDCEIRIYTGVTPNNDGNNETWHIDRIELFPENTVRIFNRWGDKVWQESGYNNTDKVWTGNNESGKPLPGGTYFYVIDFNNKTFKGWVELTR